LEIRELRNRLEDSQFGPYRTEVSLLGVGDTAASPSTRPTTPTSCKKKKHKHKKRAASAKKKHKKKCGKRKKGKKH
jgi:hypothetical protein